MKLLIAWALFHGMSLEQIRILEIHELQHTQCVEAK